MTTNRQIAEVKAFLKNGGTDFPLHYNETKYATRDGKSVFTDGELAQMRGRETRRAAAYVERVAGTPELRAKAMQEIAKSLDTE